MPKLKSQNSPFKLPRFPSEMIPESVRAPLERLRRGTDDDARNVRARIAEAGATAAQVAKWSEAAAVAADDVDARPNIPEAREIKRLRALLRRTRREVDHVGLPLLRATAPWEIEGRLSGQGQTRRLVPRLPGRSEAERFEGLPEQLAALERALDSLNFDAHRRERGGQVAMATRVTRFLDLMLKRNAALHRVSAYSHDAVLAEVVAFIFDRDDGPSSLRRTLVRNYGDDTPMSLPPKKARSK